MARFMVGIDLGTTNSALAYVDTVTKAAGGVKLTTFPVAQLVAPGELQSLPLLPSFLYLPGTHDLPPGAIALPWLAGATDVVGVYARAVGAKVPGQTLPETCSNALVLPATGSAGMPLPRVTQ